MKIFEFEWVVSHTKSLDEQPIEHIPATVPGAVQLDYAKAKGYAPYWYETNFKQFRWMEDEYFIYKTTLDFSMSEGEVAFLSFDGIDYGYIIRIDGQPIIEGEGMFAPVTLDASKYANKKHELEVIIKPIPKREGRRECRDQASASCKPASAYGWDWHPRLVPSGIWKKVTLSVGKAVVTSFTASYRLSDALDKVSVEVYAGVLGDEEVTLDLIDKDGITVYSTKKKQTGEVKFEFVLDNPDLWYPRGYGEQPIYTVVLRAGDSQVSKKIGFRRSKLVRNFDDRTPGETTFPKSRYSAPATLEVNGIKVFAKGSNWVNTEIFPSLMTENRYLELVEKAEKANMNIFRMWGGGYINHEYFYELCDQKGIMLWQEFMLSCNNFPDDDEFLSVLEKEATHIIKSLRYHPSVVMWCGGNELFNSWSGMTDQSHPLRLLGNLCYQLDRFTPFNMTSPLAGMGHGNYNTLYEKGDVTEDVAGLGGNTGISQTEEFITVLCRSYFTAYTEFGSSGGASPEYIKTWIMSEENYADMSPENPSWVAHHAFKAWNDDSWIRPGEIDYYFGGAKDTDDFMQKSLFVQAISYKALFEEMRKQWPHCSMAINWDFNEPWPCLAGNSLVNYPNVEKPALKAVGEALRNRMTSVRTRKNRFLTGETASVELWMLNDGGLDIGKKKVRVLLGEDENRKEIASFDFDGVKARENTKFGEFTFQVTEELPQVFTLTVEVEGDSELSSRYEFIRK